MAEVSLFQRVLDLQAAIALRNSEIRDLPSEVGFSRRRRRLVDQRDELQRELGDVTDITKLIAEVEHWLGRQMIHSERQALQGMVGRLRLGRPPRNTGEFLIDAWAQSAPIGILPDLGTETEPPQVSATPRETTTARTTEEVAAARRQRMAAQEPPQRVEVRTRADIEADRQAGTATQQEEEAETQREEVLNEIRDRIFSNIEQDLDVEVPDRFNRALVVVTKEDVESILNTFLAEFARLGIEMTDENLLKHGRDNFTFPEEGFPDLSAFSAAERQLFDTMPPFVGAAVERIAIEADPEKAYLEWVRERGLPQGPMRRLAADFPAVHDAYLEATKDPATAELTFPEYLEGLTPQLNTLTGELAILEDEPDVAAVQNMLQRSLAEKGEISGTLSAEVLDWLRSQSRLLVAQAEAEPTVAQAEEREPRTVEELVADVVFPGEEQLRLRNTDLRTRFDLVSGGSVTAGQPMTDRQVLLDEAFERATQRASLAEAQGLTLSFEQAAKQEIDKVPTQEDLDIQIQARFGGAPPGSRFEGGELTAEDRAALLRVAEEAGIPLQPGPQGGLIAGAAMGISITAGRALIDLERREVEGAERLRNDALLSAQSLQDFPDADLIEVMNDQQLLSYLRARPPLYNRYVRRPGFGRRQTDVGRLPGGQKQAVETGRAFLGQALQRRQQTTRTAKAQQDALEAQRKQDEEDERRRQAARAPTTRERTRI